MVDDEQNRFAEIAHSVEGGVSEDTRQVEADLRLREEYASLIGRLDSEQLGRSITILKKGQPQHLLDKQMKGLILRQNQHQPKQSWLAIYYL